jgi:hypothetical protein
MRITKARLCPAESGSTGPISDPLRSLLEMHRADREAAEEAVVALGAMGLLEQDERNPGPSEPPARRADRLGPARRAPRRIVRSSWAARSTSRGADARRSDLAEDPVVPERSLGGVDEGAPDPLARCIDRRREGHRDQFVRIPLGGECFPAKRSATGEHSIAYEASARRSRTRAWRGSDRPASSDRGRDLRAGRRPARRSRGLFHGSRRR